jgi:hypothetical protein
MTLGGFQKRSCEIAFNYNPRRVFFAFKIGPSVNREVKPFLFDFLWQEKDAGGWLLWM